MPGAKPISEKIRQELKVPIGQVIPDLKVEEELLAPYFNRTKITACVGDRTTERIHEFGFSPNLEIVDSLEKRMIREPPALDSRQQRLVIRSANPPGTISLESLENLARCLELIVHSASKVRLEVKGEEDLLALPVIAFFPENTVTFYGQPNVGMVVVASHKSRERSRRILKEMGIVSLPNVAGKNLSFFGR